MWTKNGDGTIGLTTRSLDKETTPVWTFEPLCIGGGYENRPYLNLVFCSGNDTGTSIPHKPSKFILTKSGQLQDTATHLCVGMANGVAEAGALLQLQACALTASEVAKDTQRFFLEPVTGEIKSYVPSGLPLGEKDSEIKLCLTAGWPFLTASSYITPEHKTVLVVMNEADTDTHIILSDTQRNEMMGPGLGDLWFGISARSIQTLVY
jgi:hypothetical protein